MVVGAKLISSITIVDRILISRIPRQLTDFELTGTAGEGDRLH
jgi:hypothetical protein